MVLRWLFLTCSIVWVPEVFGQAVPAMANTPATGAEAFWVSGPIFADAPKLSLGIRDILSADLNSDGRLDKVYATSKGLLVQWGEDTPELWGEPEALTLPDATGSPLQLLANGSSQLGEIQKSPFAMQGEVGWSEVPQFWVRWSAPERMLGYRFDGERLSTVTQVSLSPGLLVDVTRGGVVFGPSVDGKIYLEEFGVRRVLTARVPPLEHLQWTDVDGDGISDLLLKKREGGFGVVRLENGQMQSIQWIPKTSALKQWFTVRDTDGKLILCGRNAGQQGMHKWVLESEDGWLMRPMEGLSMFDDVSLIHAEEVMENVSYVLTMSRKWRRAMGAVWIGGTCAGQFALRASDAMGIPHFSDMNGDGVPDFSYFDHSAEQLVSHHLLRVPFEEVSEDVHAPSNDLVFLSPTSVEAARPVFEGFLSHLGSVERSEILTELERIGIINKMRISGSGVEACAESACVQWRPGPTLPGQDVERPAMEGDEAMEQRELFISQLEPSFGGPDLSLNQGEWNHVVFVMGKDGGARVCLNGDWVYQGTAEGGPFDFRIVNLGSSGGGNPSRYFSGALDEFELVLGGLSEEEIQQRFSMRQLQPHPRRALAFDFEENLDRPYPFGSDLIDFLGNWHIGKGVHGSGLVLDGKNARASIFCDLPENDFSISFWALPDPKAGHDPGLQTMLRLSGRNSLDFDACVVHPDGLRRSPLPSLARVNIEKHLPGAVFEAKGKICLMTSNGDVYCQSGFDWIPANAPDRPEKIELLGSPWLRGDCFHLVSGPRNEHLELNTSTLTWTFEGLLSSVLGNICQTIGGATGVLFLSGDSASNLQAAHWKPKHEDKLYPIHLPERGADPIVAVTNQNGWYEWIRLSGKRVQVRTERNGLVLLAYDQGIPVWTVWSGGVLLLLLGAGTYRLYQKGEEAEEAEVSPHGFSPTNPSPKRVSDLHVLPVHPEVLDRLIAHPPNAFLDVHQLDQAFLIDDIETEETRRSRRARMIKDLNAWHQAVCQKPLIERQTMEADKRRKRYRVDSGFVDWWASNRSAVTRGFPTT